MCMALTSLSLDLPVMLQLDLSMLGVVKLMLNCNKLMYANLRGSYKLTSAVSGEMHCLVAFYPRLVFVKWWEIVNCCM